MPVRKTRSPQSITAIVGRITSCVGWLGALYLAFFAMDKNAWLAFGIVLLGVAYANKFTGVEVAAIFGELGKSLGGNKIDPPKLPFPENSDDNDE